MSVLRKELSFLQSDLGQYFPEGASCMTVHKDSPVVSNSD
jgi:hypothetical protein